MFRTSCYLRLPRPLRLHPNGVSYEPVAHVGAPSVPEVRHQTTSRSGRGRRTFQFHQVVTTVT